MPNTPDAYPNLCGIDQINFSEGYSGLTADNIRTVELNLIKPTIEFVLDITHSVPLNETKLRLARLNDVFDDDLHCTAFQAVAVEGIDRGLKRDGSHGTPEERQLFLRWHRVAATSGSSLLYLALASTRIIRTPSQHQEIADYLTDDDFLRERHGKTAFIEGERKIERAKSLVNASTFRLPGIRNLGDLFYKVYDIGRSRVDPTADADLQKEPVTREKVPVPISRVSVVEKPLPQFDIPFTIIPSKRFKEHPLRTVLAHGDHIPITNSRSHDFNGFGDNARLISSVIDYFSSQETEEGLGRSISEVLDLFSVVQADPRLKEANELRSLALSLPSLADYEAIHVIINSKKVTGVNPTQKHRLKSILKQFSEAYKMRFPDTTNSK